ncbi:hypothetical protein C0Q70_05208 [Pomacea canaliculata]|uniref:AB hydrolase-1 domain-containing protein n=2 Tax=Pomacea canaliculata TaxID=400727 RepID=A0A2T7PKI4_POMCA|nr:hypothetical protein C0Q70_05208 [Pomacea canaliculata]
MFHDGFKRHSFKSMTARNSSSLSSETANEKKAAIIQSSLLKQRFIYVQTSVERWQDIPGGVFLDTAYLDSSPGDRFNPGEPVVVGLHSSPGSFYDLQPLLDACVKSGCRVLAPSFPGHGLTEGVEKEYDDVFSHTTDEKAEFIIDFLSNLGVERVDLLIAHGAACYPAMQLAAGAKTSKIFKSAAFLSPWPHQPFYAARTQKLLKLLGEMWERPFYRPLSRALSKLIPCASQCKSLQRMTLVNTLKVVDFSEVGGFAIAMDVKKYPFVMFFAEDDSYIQSKFSYELADLMGIQDNNIYHFTGQLQKGQVQNFPACFVFDKGGQNVHQMYSGIITAVILELLNAVYPKLR